MSAQALNDLNARRRPSGQFGEKLHGDSGLTLGGQDMHPLLLGLLAREGIDSRELVRYWPDNLSEAKRRVSAVRGPANGRSALIELDHHNTVPRRGFGIPALEVAGPADGRPVILNLSSGVSYLRVTSGKAIIFAGTISSNTIEVADGAEAIICAGSYTNVKVGARTGSTVTLVCNSDENKIDVWDTSGTVTKRFDPETLTVPECPDCGEAMEYGSCRGCSCACGQPAAEGPDPNLCTSCNEEATAAEAKEAEAENRRAWKTLEAMREKNEAWKAAVAAAREHNVPDETLNAVAELDSILPSSFGRLNTAADWAEERGYETGYLSYGAELDAIHQHGAIFIDEDGDWEIAVTGVGRRNSALDSEGNRDQMDYEGDENGEISPLQYILPWKKEQP